MEYVKGYSFESAPTKKGVAVTTPIKNLREEEGCKSAVLHRGSLISFQRTGASLFFQIYGNESY